MNMKKITYTALFALGFGVSAAQAAGVVQEVTAATITSSPTTGTCTLLSEDIIVSLSNNVVGAYLCDDTTLNVIYVSTCHKGSSLKKRNVKCQVIGSANNTHAYNDGGTVCNGTLGQTWGFTAEAQVAYVATSSGGSVSTMESAVACNDVAAPTAVINTAKTALEAL